MSDDFLLAFFGKTAINQTTLTAGTNVAGYFADGWDGGEGTGPGRIYSFATTGQVIFSGDSGWFIMNSVDSYNGQRVTFQSSYQTWFATNAFGGTNYSNTPIGAVSTVEEPYGNAVSVEVYYGNWAAGKSFAISAWSAMASQYFQAAGDPFVRK